MGFDIQLQDEHGSVIKSTGDPKNFLHRLLPDLADKASIMLRFIDWNANTTFNRRQMRQFLEEWERLLRKAKSDEERVLLEEVKELAIICQSQPHHYLKFIGD